MTQVAGQSGSGKSLAVLELETRLAQEFSFRNDKAATAADDSSMACMDVVVRVTLPELSDPLTTMIEETLRTRWCCTEAQITELRNRVVEGTVRMTFIIDGYDELRAELVGKNLYKSNNLEKWRATKEHDAKNFCYPKVVIFTRSELLAGWTSYESVFVPLESENVDKDDVAEAVDYFTEYRIAPFTAFTSDKPRNKVQEYVRAHVAVATRGVIQCYFGVHDEANTGLQQLRKAVAALTETHLLEIAKTLHEVRSNRAASTDGIKAALEPLRVAYERNVAPTAVRNCFDDKTLLGFLNDTLSDEFWTTDTYFEKFKEMTELQELTRTAFMMKILCTILPRLVATSDNSMTTKRDLILLLDDEDKAGVLVSALRDKGIATRANLLSKSNGSE